MTLALSVAIMHHPSRDGLMPWLLRRLGREDVTVVTDHDGDGPWPTARRAWQARDPSATHHLLLQDDALLCDDFLHGVVWATIAVGGAPTSFFYLHGGRKVIDPIVARGDHWCRIRDVSGVAVCLPTWMVDDFLTWVDAHIAPEMPYDDTRLSLYLQSTQQDVWLTVPSLVDHLSVKSIIHARASHRQARHFLGSTRSAKEIDWNRGVLDAPLYKGRNLRYMWKDVLR